MLPVEGFPASYRGDNHSVEAPSDHPHEFLLKELSLGKLEMVLNCLGFAGSKHPAGPLHYQISIGRNIVITERMDLHLLWANDGRIFIKPLPRFLLDSGFWTRYLTCQPNCGCHAPPTSDTPSASGPVLQIEADTGKAGEGSSSGANGVTEKKPASKNRKKAPQPQCTQKKLRKIALGFMYTYACLISYESDFAIAKKQRLLPRMADDSMPHWEDWKKLVQEILASYDQDKVHQRFHRGELRLSRLNTIHRFTQLPPFDPYFRGWRHYGDLFQDNLTWLATAVVFIALVLTAMQVGLATDQLKANNSFMAASYGFTVFAILGPLCVFGLVLLAALYNLLKDLPYLLGLKSKRSKATHPANAPTQEGQV